MLRRALGEESSRGGTVGLLKRTGLLLTTIDGLVGIGDIGVVDGMVVDILSGSLRGSGGGAWR